MKIETKEEFLRYTDPILVDKSIQEIRWIDYDTRGADPNKGGIISLKMLDTNPIALLEQSYLIIEFTIKKPDGSRFADADLITLTNNGIMFAFDNVQLLLNNKPIEQYANVGVTTTAFGYFMNNYGFSSTEGPAYFWVIDTDRTASSSNKGFETRHKLLFENNKTSAKGSCKVIIPFNNIFGFKGKVIFGLDACINLNRSMVNDPIFRASAAGDGTLQITNIVWRIPTIILSSLEETNLYKITESNAKIEMGFLTRQSQHKPVPQTKFFSWNFDLSGNERVMGIVLFFQTDISDNQEKNPALFNHCNLTNAKVILNSCKYPGIDLKCNFETNDYMECYQRYVEFRRKFTDQYSEINPMQFKNLYPMFVFDVSKQEGRVTGNSISAQIECNFSSNVAASTMAYVLILSDKMLQFEYANVNYKNIMKFLF